MFDNQNILSKLLSRRKLKEYLTEINYQYILPEDAISGVLDRVMNIAGIVSREQFEEILNYEYQQSRKELHLKSIVFISGNRNIVPTATVVLDIRKFGEEANSETGNGPIDAAYRAIQRTIKKTGLIEDLEQYRLVRFSIRSSGWGANSEGEATVTLERDARQYSGSGSSTDIVRAAVEAYISVLNKIIIGENADNRGLRDDSLMEESREEIPVLVEIPEVLCLDYVQYLSGNRTSPTATITLNVKNRGTEKDTDTGNGPIEAIFKAIDRIFNRITDDTIIENIRMTEFLIDTLGYETNSIGCSKITLEYLERPFYGTGEHTDVVVAATKAYINVLNQILENRGRL
jgi:hypothetical protein